MIVVWNEQRFKKTISNIITALLVLVLSLVLFIVGHDSKDYHWALCGVLLFWMYGMAFGLVDLSKLYGYTIMNFMLFVFFLSRPTIANLFETGWTEWEYWILENALFLILVSEIALFFGAFFVKQPPRTESLKLRKSPNYNESVQTALLVTVLITSVICAFSVLRNYYHYASLAYEELYVPSGEYDNALIRAATTVFPYAVFAYLATIPSKKKSLFVLGIYVIMGLPTFLLGNRASLVLRIAFAVAYFFIRDFTNDLYSKRWIKKSVIIGFSIFVLASIAFLGAFNYYRAGLDPNNEVTMPIMVDFFYRQGTTFDTVCQGLKYQSEIMRLPHGAGYSIGPIYDMVVHSTLAQKLFDTTIIGNGNSINMVMNGNSLAHKLSYIVMGETSYLSGHGRGSSYLIELYYDGGVLFLTVFSFFIGFYLANLNRIVQKGGWFINTLVIASLSRIFYIPRASAFDFVAFLFTPHFWLIVCVVIAVLFFESLKDKEQLNVFQKLRYYHNKNKL